MKKLSELIKATEEIKERGGYVEGEGRSPLFTNFCDFPELYDELLEPFKVGKGKKKDIPKELIGLLIEAFAFGAAVSLRTLKYGQILRDAEGNAYDRAYYSLDELLSEAQAIACPNSEKENLEQELEFLKSEEEDEHEEVEENGEQEDELAVLDSPSKHLH